MDVGYGVHGAQIFNLVEGATENPYLKIIAVINVSRPFTATVDDIVEYVSSLGRVDALLNNTHNGEETRPEIVERGARIVMQAAERLKLPVVASSAVRELAEEIGPLDCVGNPIWPLDRFMPRSFW